MITVNSTSHLRRAQHLDLLLGFRHHQLRLVGSIESALLHLLRPPELSADLHLHRKHQLWDPGSTLLRILRLATPHLASLAQAHLRVSSRKMLLRKGVLNNIRDTSRPTNSQHCRDLGRRLSNLGPNLMDHLQSIRVRKLSVMASRLPLIQRSIAAPHHNPSLYQWSPYSSNNLGSRLMR